MGHQVSFIQYYNFVIRTNIVPIYTFCTCCYFSCKLFKQTSSLFHEQLRFLYHQRHSVPKPSNGKTLLRTIVLPVLILLKSFLFLEVHKIKYLVTIIYFILHFHFLVHHLMIEQLLLKNLFLKLYLADFIKYFYYFSTHGRFINLFIYIDSNSIFSFYLSFFFKLLNKVCYIN